MLPSSSYAHSDEGLRLNPNSAYPHENDTTPRPPGESIPEQERYVGGRGPALHTNEQSELSESLGDIEKLRTRTGLVGGLEIQSSDRVQNTSGQGSAPWK